MSSIIKSVMDGDWAGLQTDIEKMASDKVRARIDDKKVDVLARFNGIDTAKQKEILAVSK